MFNSLKTIAMKKLIGSLSIVFVFFLFSCGPRPETADDHKVYEESEILDKEAGMVEREVGERSPATDLLEEERQAVGEPELIERSAGRDQNALEKSVARDQELMEEKRTPVERNQEKRE